jgi:hypothetical protein
MAIRRWLALQRAARWARFGRVDTNPPFGHADPIRAPPAWGRNVTGPAPYA